MIVRTIQGILFAGLLWLGGVASGVEADKSVRLGLVNPDGALGAAVDVLTAEFSKSAGVTLLERTEIERVYKEQALLASGRDVVKLGQILGADGLLILDTVREGQSNYLSMRLVAVKPGVVLDSARQVWPVGDMPTWSGGVRQYFAPLFPKLKVQTKDALPISVVNLRSAVRSKESEELEQQITLLTTERLTRERELFVLERRRLELLSAEKELDLDGANFWNGSYLLEGTIDRDGYTQDRLTIDARLSPPSGKGATVEMKVVASRRELGMAVEQLNAKVLQALRRDVSAVAWKPEEEALKYYEEAKWALKWGMLKEAQAAAESAWALGKRDMDAALVRIRSYLPEVPPAQYTVGKMTQSAPKDRAERIRRELPQKYPLGYAWTERFVGNGIEVNQIYATRFPEPEALDRALHVLGLYSDFTRTLPVTEPVSHSVWYDCGLDTLEICARTLVSFWLVSKHEGQPKEKLAEVRAATRQVTARLMETPSVRNNYWLNDRMASADELRAPLVQYPNIFRVQLKYGSLWQETPEDCVKLYRKLLDSPAFCYIHEGFWNREPSQPWLISWDENSRERAQKIWTDFLGEINQATNFLWRIQGKALEVAYPVSDAAKEKAFEEMFAIISSNRTAIVTSKVQIKWDWYQLLYRSGVTSETVERLQRSPRLSELAALDDEWRENKRQIDNTKRRADEFENQKEYLRNVKTFDHSFFLTFGGLRKYTEAEAKELAPLLANYKTHAAAKAEEAKGRDRAELMGVLRNIRSLEEKIDKALHPETVVDRPKIVSSSPNPQSFSNAPAARLTNVDTVDILTNALMVDRFISLPMNRGTRDLPDGEITEVNVAAQQFYEGKVWLDVRFIVLQVVEKLGKNGGVVGWRNVETFRSAMLIWNAQKDNWSYVPYPETTNATGPSTKYSEVAQEAIYVSESQYLRRYDLTANKWESLNVPWQKAPRLFRVDDRLFAANDEAIFEIQDQGRKIEILASCRRRPAKSALDGLSSLGQAVVFPGDGTSIRAFAAGMIYSWNGGDWGKVIGESVSTVKVFERITLVSQGEFGPPVSLWSLPHSSTNLQFLLRHERHDPAMGAATSANREKAQPRWKSRQLSFGKGATTMLGSNFCSYLEHGRQTNINNRWVMAEQDGRNGELIYLDQELAAPVLVPLRFNVNLGQVPSGALDRNRLSPFGMKSALWMMATDQLLLIGKETVPGFWAVSRQELEAALAMAKPYLKKFASEESVRSKIGQRSAPILSDRNKEGAKQ